MEESNVSAVDNDIVELGHLDEEENLHQDLDLNEDAYCDKKHSSDGESVSTHRRTKSGGDTEVRLLIPSRVARAIIGKGGHNISKLRNEYRGFISVPDCPGPERILSIFSDQSTVLNVVKDIVPLIEELSNRPSSRSDEIDLRLLIHQSLVGCVIGKAGVKVQKLQEKTGARVKIFSKCCPQSTDRVCLTSGKPNACLQSLEEILELLKIVPVKGPNTPYDPLNFDTYLTQEYGGYEPENKCRSTNLKRSEFDERLTDNFGIKREGDGDLGPLSKRSRVGGDTEIRLLIPSKVARGIIGRGGNNIRRLRTENSGFISVPDCPGPERILTISSDPLSALQIISDVIPYVEEASNRNNSRNDEVELRLLVHQSLAGCIIGMSGLRIQKLEELTGARIKLFSKCCPQSTDRVCQISGRPKSCVKAIKVIIDFLKSSPLKGSSSPYDPRNFDVDSIEDYGGYREQENKIYEKKSELGIDSSPLKGVDDPLQLVDVDSGSKEDGDSEKNSVHKYFRSAGDADIRFLIPSKMARAIIGKGGQNIKKLRSEYKASITIRDCPGPERIFTISSELDTIQQILNTLLPTFEEMSNYDEIELRLLIHRSQVGCIIGKSGSKIQRLQENTGARVKLFAMNCPQSTDRVCQITGKESAPLECFREIMSLLETCPVKGSNIPYDARNFDDYSAQDYGGYVEGSKLRISVRGGFPDSGIRSGESPLSRRSFLGKSDDLKVRSHEGRSIIKNDELLQLVEEQEAEIQSLKKRIFLTGI